MELLYRNDILGTQQLCSSARKKGSNLEGISSHSETDWECTTTIETTTTMFGGIFIFKKHLQNQL